MFELLQNADDNRFTRARANGALPFISFEVHPDQIIVECNEDGFTGNDLSAICSVGESTKSGSHGYIGAKGIGFKSVFIAARKVDIQSGNFSFYFKHERGDLGLGMVLPVWMDTDKELSPPLTCMTLHLHDKGDQAELQHLRDTIFKQMTSRKLACCSSEISREYTCHSTTRTEICRAPENFEWEAWTTTAFSSNQVRQTEKEK